MNLEVSNATNKGSQEDGWTAKMNTIAKIATLQIVEMHVLILFSHWTQLAGDPERFLRKRIVPQAIHSNHQICKIMEIRSTNQTPDPTPMKQFLNLFLDFLHIRDLEGILLGHCAIP